MKELLRDGPRAVWFNKCGFGKAHSISIEGDEITIKLKIDRQGREDLAKFDYDKGDRIGDIDLNHFNIHPRKLTLDRVKTLLSGYPMANWAIGKENYKLYLEGLQAQKLYIHELQNDLTKDEFKEAIKLLNFSLEQSGPILNKIHELQHELMHLKHPHAKPVLEGEVEDKEHLDPDA